MEPAKTAYILSPAELTYDIRLQYWSCTDVHIGGHERIQIQIVSADRSSRQNHIIGWKLKATNSVHIENSTCDQRMYLEI